MRRAERVAREYTEQRLSPLPGAKRLWPVLAAVDTGVHIVASDGEREYVLSFSPADLADLLGGRRFRVVNLPRPEGISSAMLLKLVGRGVVGAAWL